MTEAMSGFWSAWISIITLGVVGGCWWLLFANRKTDKAADANGEVQTTGHAADGIEEYDNPLPRWWFLMFVGTIIFAIFYLILYPGLGNWKGLLGWTSTGQWEEEVAYAEEYYAPIFQDFAKIEIPTLAKDPEAMKVGQRIFQNNCSVCHGSAGKGAYGFPNLTDTDWLYGGDPEAIKYSIINGRNGQMPAWESVLGEEGIKNLTQYVLSLSDQQHDTTQAAAGQPLFTAMCVACHGADAKGMHALGAPNLTDNVWLYKQPQQSLAESIEYTLRYGRNGHMPAQQQYIGEDKVHILAAYVYSLSQK
ncbi:cytochrome c oxidase cbb3-type subunit 3 [Allopseudospirillum japonicum]|uniref:Cbb3-type cytochrome c oxidase subunit n=1 Tax=Allopseudospirillum japonicum TaxID=64971 RepID=A0A1H6TFW9_9GAMM|nr:cytochrome-c oxidase, cbb3-type subunit III [Allopseudospirillum japonicum]SEI78891.1 cytochrome c oxidase cbb3-type subunit 3 [Allopseudospirillum japonicum]